MARARHKRPRRNGAATTLGAVTYRGQKLVRRKRANSAAVLGVSTGTALAAVAAGGALWWLSQRDAGSSAPETVAAAVVPGTTTYDAGAPAVGSADPNEVWSGGKRPRYKTGSGKGLGGYGFAFGGTGRGGFGGFGGGLGNQPAIWNVAPVFEPVGLPLDPSTAFGGAAFGKFFDFLGIGKGAKERNAAKQAAKQAQQDAVNAAGQVTSDTLTYTQGVLAQGSGAGMYVGGGVAVALLIGVLAIAATHKMDGHAGTMRTARANRRRRHARHTSRKRRNR